MTTAQTPQVHFLRVTDNTSKLETLCRVVHEHFTKKHRILIAAPTAEAAKFLDVLLWKSPSESFIPHAIATAATEERVVITTATTNVNRANVLINLTGAIPSVLNTVEVVYELFDLTSPEKEKASLSRQAEYARLGVNP